MRIQCVHQLCSGRPSQVVEVMVVRCGGDECSWVGLGGTVMLGSKRKASNGTSTHTFRANKLSTAEFIYHRTVNKEAYIQAQVKHKQAKVLMSFYYRTVNAKTHTYKNWLTN